jgi:hypothetical protein
MKTVNEVKDECYENDEDNGCQRVTIHTGFPS